MSGGVFDAGRLAAVAATGLLDTPAEPAFDRLARLAATVLGTPYAFVTLVDDRRSFWKSCIGVDATDLADRQNSVEESFCQYVVNSGTPLIVDDTVSDARTSENPSNESMGVRAWAGYPVRGPGGDILGTFCVVDTRTRRWTERDAEVLQTLAAAAGGEIALRFAAGRAADYARTLQESLLPPELPTIDGIEVAATYRSAEDGGGIVGDFFDVFHADGRWFLLIGDVCGHGVEAAKMAAFARWTVRATAETGTPAEVLRAVHHLLVRRHGVDTFLTAQLATLAVRPDGDVDVVLAGAGHPPALVRRGDGRVDERGLGGRLLGVLAEADVAEERFALHRDDVLVLYTDGLVEARQGLDLLGQRAVEELLGASVGHTPAALAAALEAAAVDASAGCLQDDVAIVVVRPDARR